MRCIFCGNIDSKVVDSRYLKDTSIRRRRECLSCGRRCNTYETIEVTPVIVVKSNGTRERFSTTKVKNGILKACEKRPVSIADIDKLVSEIEKKVYNNLDQEISSTQIGEMEMNGLKFFTKNGGFSGNDIKEILEYAQNNPYEIKEAKLNIEKLDNMKKYCADLQEMIKKGVDETRGSWYRWRHTAFGAVAERLKAPVC